MNLRTTLSAAVPPDRSTPDRHRRHALGSHRSPTARRSSPGLRRPALFLAVAAAGAVMVNVLSAGEPAAHADAAHAGSASPRSSAFPPSPTTPVGRGAAPAAEPDRQRSRASDDGQAAAAQAAGTAADQHDAGSQLPPQAGQTQQQAAEQAHGRGGREGGRAEAAAQAAAAGRRPLRPPRPPRRRLLPGLRAQQARWQPGPVLLPENLWGKESGWNPNAQNPSQHRLRHPAVPRLHLGRAPGSPRPRTATGRSTPDWSTSTAATAPRAARGRTPAPTTGTDGRPALPLRSAMWWPSRADGHHCADLAESGRPGGGVRRGRPGCARLRHQRRLRARGRQRRAAARADRELTVPTGRAPMSEHHEDGQEPTPAAGAGRPLRRRVRPPAARRSPTGRAASPGAVPSRLSPARAAQPARRACPPPSCGPSPRRSRAQRQSITAMRAQLDAFDQQLAVFERILDPLVEWSGTWARLEEAVGDFVRPSRRPGRPLRSRRRAADRPSRSSPSLGRRRRRIPVTEPTRVCACRRPAISGMRSSWMRRRVSGTVSTTGSSRTLPTRSRPGLAAPAPAPRAPRPAPRAARRSAAPRRSSRGPRGRRGELPDGAVQVAQGARQLGQRLGLGLQQGEQVREPGDARHPEPA